MWCHPRRREAAARNSRAESEAGTRRTPVRWDPTHGDPPDQPSLLTGSASADDQLGSDADENVTNFRRGLDSGSHSNARSELLPEAGARHERTLEAVSSRPLLGRNWHRMAPWHPFPSAAPRMTCLTTPPHRVTPLPCQRLGGRQAVPTARLHSSAAQRAGAGAHRHDASRAGRRGPTHLAIRRVDGRSSRRWSRWCALVKHQPLPLLCAPPDGTAQRMPCTAIAVVQHAPIGDERDGGCQGFRGKLQKRQPPRTWLCCGCEPVRLPIPAARPAAFDKVIGEQRRHFLRGTAHFGPQALFLQPLQFRRICRPQAHHTRDLR